MPAAAVIDSIGRVINIIVLRHDGGRLHLDDCSRRGWGVGRRRRLRDGGRWRLGPGAWRLYVAPATGQRENEHSTQCDSSFAEIDYKFCFIHGGNLIQ